MTSLNDVTSYKCNTNYIHTSSKLMTSLNKIPPIKGMQTKAVMKKQYQQPKTWDCPDKGNKIQRDVKKDLVKVVAGQALK